jgi:hypothetical protein
MRPLLQAQPIPPDRRSITRVSAVSVHNGTATARRRWSDSYAFLMPTSDCVGDAGIDGSEVILLLVREGVG